MKRIRPILLTAFSALALSFAASATADNVDNDGFIIFDAQAVEATSTESTPKVVQKKPKAKKKMARKARKSKKRSRKKSRKRATRATRQTRTVRTTRKQRSKSLRRASSYKVRRGDTLYRISVNSGVKLSRLVRLNNLGGSKKHNIQAGQRIRLR